jgi:LmbE family N-acetylglucosaminyl deacetylase
MFDTRLASLLVVMARPDDEVFHGGILAQLSERGVRVTLVCATDGEAGTPHPSVGPVEDLGARRVEELKLSCERLGLVAVSFDASAYVERKFFALTAHRSAFGVTPAMLDDPPQGVAQMLRAFRPVLQREVFLLGRVRGTVPRWPLADFFDGLDTAN